MTNRKKRRTAIQRPFRVNAFKSDSHYICTITSIGNRNANSVLSLHILTALLAVFCSLTVIAQDTADRIQQPYMFFPHPMESRKWQVSLGATLTTWPQDITEEVQVRVPAIDLHAIRRIGGHWYLDGRITSQLVQSHVSMGFRYAKVLGHRFSFSVGDDMAWWYGVLNIASFRTNARGWFNYPNASIGYRFGKGVLLTLHGEALLNMGYTTSISKEVRSRKGFQFSGVAGGLILEQPFHKNTHIITGLRAQYTNFFWQTWPLFETFDRNIFYPEIIVGIIL